MPIDTKTPNSPGWWLHRLARKLERRQPRLQELIDRLEGNPPLPQGADAARESFQRFQRLSRTNFSELLVEAARERMTVAGFRTGAGGTEQEGDEEATRIWDANRLAVESADVHEMMLAAGDSYVIVGGPDNETGVPVITGEDPRQVVTVHDPVQQRKVRAALKVFHDLDRERDYAYLYLPGQVWVATRDVRRRTKNQSVRFNPSTWDWDEDLTDELPFDVVPVVRFRNRRGTGEFENHVDLLDRINQQILQRLVIATLQAFRQRAVKNLPEEDDEGNELDYTDVFTSDPGALWQVPGGVEFWESGSIDLTPILSAVKDDVRDLAAVTRTPLSYLNPDAASQSAEGASLMREGLVFKVEDRIIRATEGWKDVMSLAFLFSEDQARADRNGLEVLWIPPERRSLAERADAASKGGDIPWRTRMTDIWQFAPKKVDQMEAERSNDLILTAAFGQPELPGVEQPGE